jgi:hypothetical protein
MYIFNVMEQSPCWETNSYSAGQEIHAFYETRRFIIMLRKPAIGLCPETRECNTHHFIYLGSIIVLSSNLRPGLQVVSSLQIFQLELYI